MAKKNLKEAEDKSGVEADSKNLVKSAKLKVEHLQSQSLAPALSKLTTLNVEPHMAYWIARFVKKLQSAGKEINAARETALKRYADLDENGAFKVAEDGQNIKFKDDAGYGEFEKEWLTFCGTEISGWHLNRAELIKTLNEEKIKIQPSVFAALDDFMF